MRFRPLLPMLLMSCIETELHPIREDVNPGGAPPVVSIDTGDADPLEDRSLLVTLSVDTSGSMINDSEIYFGLGILPIEFTPWGDWTIAVIAADSSAEPIYVTKAEFEQDSWAIAIAINDIKAQFNNAENVLDGAEAAYLYDPSVYSGYDDHVVVLATDEPDYSVVDPLEWRSHTPWNTAWVTIISGPDEGGTSGCSAMEAPRLHSVQDKWVDICTSGWKVLP